LFSANVVISQSSCKCPGLSAALYDHSGSYILSTQLVINFKCILRWLITIYTNHPGGNHGHKYKTIRFDLMGERPAKIIPKSAQQTKKSRKTSSPQIKAHVF